MSPGSGTKGYTGPNPQGHLFQLGALIQPAPPWAHNYLAFPEEGRRGREKGRGVPVCCCPRSPLRAPSLPDRKPAPIPSQLQLCPPAPPPPTRPTESHSPQRLAGPATPPRLFRLLCSGPLGPAYPRGGPSPQAPPLGPQASPLPPPRWSHAGLLVRNPTKPLSPRSTGF